jgi:hypothetical protein
MGIVENVKEMAKLAHEVQNLELYKKLIDFQNEVFSLYDENRSLKDEVRQLTERLNLREKIHLENNMYWVTERDIRLGPYCPACYGKKGKTVQLLTLKGGHYGCVICGFMVRTDGSTPSPAWKSELRGMMPSQRDE